MIGKKLTSLWTRGVKRIIKLQQNKSKKLIKSLLVKPATKVRRRTTAAPAIRRQSPVAEPRTRPAAILSIPGKWLKSYESKSILAAGGSANRMSYWLYLPSQSARSRLPLVIMLHGCAQTATQFAQCTRMNFLAEKKGFAVLYPQRPASRDPSRCWHWY